MVKTEFIKAIAQRANLTNDKAREVYNAIEDIIAETLPKEKITLVGFGSIELKHREPRVALNPATGAKINLPAQDVPAFKFVKAYKERF